MTRPSSFEEFWPDYLRAHSDPRSRALHIAGTAAGIAQVLFIVFLVFALVALVFGRGAPTV